MCVSQVALLQSHLTLFTVPMASRIGATIWYCTRRHIHRNPHRHSCLPRISRLPIPLKLWSPPSSLDTSDPLFRPLRSPFALGCSTARQLCGIRIKVACQRSKDVPYKRSTRDRSSTLGQERDDSIRETRERCI